MPDGLEPGGERHLAQATEPTGPLVPRWVKLAGVGLALVAAAAVAFAVFQPIQVLPRIGLAPGYTLLAQDGTRFTSEDARGGYTLYTFEPTGCGDRCAEIDATMRAVAARAEAEVALDGRELHLVTVALDPVADPAVLQAAAARSGADGVRWRWVGGDPTRIRTLVGSGFHRWYQAGADGSIDFDRGFVLVDPAGVVRGDYRYRTESGDADKLVHHLAILTAEIRNAHGAASVAYEAAHVFLCYP